MEEVVAMGSGVGREISSVFQVWDYLTLQVQYIHSRASII